MIIMPITFAEDRAPGWEELREKIMEFPKCYENTKEKFPGDLIQSSYRWIKLYVPPAGTREYCLEEISENVPLHCIICDELVYVLNGNATFKVGDKPGEKEQAIKEQYSVDTLGIIGRSAGTAWSIEPRDADTPLLIRTLITPPLNHLSNLSVLPVGTRHV